MAFSDNLHDSPASHFVSNLKHIKDVSIVWFVKKMEIEYKELVEIEILISAFSHKIGFGFSSDEDKDGLIDLESRKRKILLDREHEARQKSRAIWLMCGDDNTSFFHKFANQRKNANSIWKIKDDRGDMVEGFEAIAGAGVQHFETLFQADTNLHLTELLKISGNFLSSITAEENSDLTKPVTLEEINTILTLSKNDKSPGPDGIPVEVYRVLFDVMSLDLLRVIEDSRKNGKIPAVFNSTFIALIPKSDCPCTFDGYRPISLCNFSYKIIGKIISTRIKKVLGRYISNE